MANPEEANKAVELCNGKDFQGRVLTINIARPRDERPSRPPFQGSRDGGRDGGRPRY